MDIQYMYITSQTHKPSYESLNLPMQKMEKKEKQIVNLRISSELRASQYFIPSLRYPFQLMSVYV